MHADLFYELIRQPSALTNVPVEKIEQLTREYPWFGAAQQLLYLKKAVTKTSDSKDQLQKAAVYSLPQRTLELLYSGSGLADFVNAPTNIQTAPVSGIESDQNRFDAIQDAEVTIEAEATIDLLHGQEQHPVEHLDIPVVVSAPLESNSFKNQDLTDAVADALANVELADQQDMADQQPVSAGVPESAKNEASVIDQKAQTGKSDFLFEPYHAVDYFASQGIKLKEDKLGNDELSRQLKTFTQWLRTMKKVYVEEKKELDPQQEKLVIEIASVSNQNAEILTETMAEVLLQQGKKDQAAEIYQKLILLHPEKSSYFAQRIESLKS